MTIGERIRYYRLKNGLKQHQLAELIGVSPQAISKWETDTGCPDISMLVPLARALGTTTDRLLDGQGEADTESEWDSMALAYEVFNNSPDSYSYTIEWPCVQQLLPELRGKRILDVGCGTGIFTFLLEQYFPEKVVCLMPQERREGSAAPMRIFCREMQSILRIILRSPLISFFPLRQHITFRI